MREVGVTRSEVSAWLGVMYDLKKAGVNLVEAVKRLRSGEPLIIQEVPDPVCAPDPQLEFNFEKAAVREEKYGKNLIRAHIKGSSKQLVDAGVEEYLKEYPRAGYNTLIEHGTRLEFEAEWGKRAMDLWSAVVTRLGSCD